MFALSLAVAGLWAAIPMAVGAVTRKRGQGAACGVGIAALWVGAVWIAGEMTRKESAATMALLVASLVTLVACFAVCEMMAEGAEASRRAAELRLDRSERLPKGEAPKAPAKRKRFGA